jgi:hypothetical protein
MQELLQQSSPLLKEAMATDPDNLPALNDGALRPTW